MRNLVKTLLAAAALMMGLLPLSASVQAADRYQPFILAERSTGNIADKVEEVKESLLAAGFDVVGEYKPYDGAEVVIFTSDALRKVAATSEYGGFAMAQRAAVTQVGEELQVAYVNPRYMAYAYRMKTDLSNTADALEQALGKLEEFGTERGMTERKLKKYHYTFGMEYFDDVYELAEFGSYKEALAAVEKNLENNNVGIRPVYRIDVAGKDETIIGVAMTAGPEGDKYMDDQFQMGIVDFNELKGTPYLPYEIMVTGDEVVALHMRFRMAVHFPDLKMMGDNSFMKLMPSPEAIRKALEAAVTGE